MESQPNTSVQILQQRFQALREAQASVQRNKERYISDYAQPYEDDIRQRALSNSRSRQPTPLELSRVTFSPASQRVLQRADEACDDLKKYQQLLNAHHISFAEAGSDTAAQFEAAASQGEARMSRREDDTENLFQRLAEIRLEEDEGDAQRIDRRIEQIAVARAAKEEEARRLTPLEDETVNKFHAICRRSRSTDDDIVAEFFKYRVRQKDIKTLRDRTWLNDEVVNAFFVLLDQEQPKLATFSTFFITTLMGNRGYAGVRRWTKRRKLDVFSMDQVFVPVNIHNTHWTMVGCDMNAKTVTYYDSMNGNGEEYVTAVMDYFAAEHADKKDGAELDVSEWTVLPVAPRRIPQQRNGVDCGAFTCVCAMHLARGLPLEYSQSQISEHWRPYLACSVLLGKALPR